MRPCAAESRAAAARCAGGALTGQYISSWACAEQFPPPPGVTGVSAALHGFFPALPQARHIFRHVPGGRVVLWSVGWGDVEHWEVAALPWEPG